MSATARMAALAAQAVAIAGALTPWLASIPGVQIALAALTSQHEITRGVPGAGWIVIGAAAIAASAALAGNHLLVITAAVAQLITIADFTILEAIRRAPGTYGAADIAPGCWMVLAASVAGILIAVASRQTRKHQGAHR
ncbi:MAG: hypothetical protein JOY82_05890 [Streptosporangiaceae bacterium]|nr:hypothetical protein [Streptosporangiaceae bacterium]MBV9854041.1 hypothetical protein [Streptosporangiaceae bacterium]